jgi:hypothetical protein
VEILDPQLNALDSIVAMDAHRARWSARPYAEFKVLAHLYKLASESPKSTFTRALDEIAKLASLPQNKAGSAMDNLVSAGIIEIVRYLPDPEGSPARKSCKDYPSQPFVYRIPRRYLNPPHDPTSVFDGCSLDELFRWLTGYHRDWISPELYASFMAAANQDEELLQTCLASLLRDRTMTHQSGRRLIKRVFLMSSSEELISAVRDKATAQAVQFTSR